MRGSSFRDFITLFPYEDLVILEGFKYSSYHKIGIVQSGVSYEPVGDLTKCIALVSNMTLDTDLPAFHIDAVESISEYVAQFRNKAFCKRTCTLFLCICTLSHLYPD